MKSGEIKMQLPSGDVVYRANIWVLLTSYIVLGREGFDLRNCQVYIDGEEVLRPLEMDDET